MRSVKQKAAVILAVILVLGGIAKVPGIVKAEGSGNAQITYHNGVMSGMGLSNVIDGNYDTTYVSEDEPDMTEGKQYFQFAWEQEVDYNAVTLYANYCGTADRAGQAPTKWKIQTSSDGTVYTDMATVTSDWKDTDDLQSKEVRFTLSGTYRYLRVLILEANLSWNHYAVNEIEFSKKTGGEEGGSVKGYEDSNGTIQYAKEATITYHDEAMSGMGLLQVADGDYATAYVSEDDPDMTKQYIQYTWAAPIDINLVTLYSQYCGAQGRAGQAPTEWSIQVSKDGVNYTEVCKVTNEWHGNDEVQSKNALFTLQEDITAMRVFITKANLDWKHYVITELEAGKAKEGFVPTDITGETSQDEPIDKTYKDANGVTQYAKAAAITYNDGTMSGMGLQQVADGDYTTTYVSEENPDMSGQYIQFTWDKPININLVTLYAQYCGTKYKDGQAPVKWNIQVSKDGTNFTEVCQVSHKWRSNDNVQSKTAQFDLQEGVVAMRLVITEAKLDWKHYAIGEIEVGQAPEGYIAADLTGIGDGTTSQRPETGDDATLLIWLASCMLSLGAIYTLVYCRRRTLR